MKKKEKNPIAVAGGRALLKKYGKKHFSELGKIKGRKKKINKK